MRAGKTHGINFNLGRRFVNSIAAHSALEYALLLKGPTVQHELAELFFSSYFEGGENIADKKVIASSLVKCGFSALEVQEYEEQLEEGSLIQMVLDKDNRAKRSGIKSVPHVVVSTGSSTGTNEVEVRSEMGNGEISGILRSLVGLD
mmetsp:Transcript_27835/g.70931  ORF Transcript_27835/g.70931 Transcript_27835/m.70931 type:complete len:147 (+) Transcript_27835:311-751(+)